METQGKKIDADDQTRLSKKLALILEEIGIKKQRLMGLGKLEINDSRIHFSLSKNFKKVKSALFEYLEALSLYHDYAEGDFNDLYNYCEKMADSSYTKKEYTQENFEQFFKYNDLINEMDILYDIQTFNPKMEYIDKVRDIVENHCKKIYTDEGSGPEICFSLPDTVSISKRYDEIVLDVDFSDPKDILFKIKAGTDIHYARKIVAIYFLRQRKDSRYYEMQVRKYFFLKKYSAALHTFPNIDDSLVTVQDLKDEYFTIQGGNIVLDKGNKNENDYSDMRRFMNILTGLKISMATSLISGFILVLILFCTICPFWIKIPFSSLSVFYFVTSLIFIKRKTVNKVVWYIGVFGLIPMIFISFFVLAKEWFAIPFVLFINTLFLIGGWLTCGCQFKSKRRFPSNIPSQDLIVFFNAKRIYTIFSEDDPQSIDNSLQTIDAREFYNRIRFIIYGGSNNFKSHFEQVFKCA